MRPHPDGADLAAAAVPMAQRLAGAVRDTVEDVAAILDPLDRDQLRALAVVLAAMVDIDRPAAELLAWVDSPAPVRRDHPHWLPEGHRFTPVAWTDEALRLAHAAHARGDRDEWTRAGEREYQHRNYLRRKGERVAS